MTLDITPMATPRPKVGRGRAYYPKKYKDYLRNVKMLAGDLELDTTVSITFFMPMPKSWSKAKRQGHYMGPHQQTPDLDNLVKGVMDALGEDKHVAHIEARKWWDVEGSIDIHTEPW